MIEWVQYIQGVHGGLSPDYCKDCQAKPDALTPCVQCPAPEILPENLPAISLYAQCNTLWRRDAMGNLCGLDYAGLAAMMGILDIAKKRQAILFSKIQVIESEVLSIVKAKQSA